MTNNETEDLLIDDGYDSNDEIKLEITDYQNGRTFTQVFQVPYRPTHSNEKRLVCFSIINNESCIYGYNCTYAHSLDEQIVDPDKKFIYEIVLDQTLMNFFSITNPKTDEIYKQLLFLTHLCEKCVGKKCTGGYNCRNGVCNPSLKLCKNDLLTGECLNKVVEIEIDPLTLKKIKVDKCVYRGCINGHHLTDRGLVPYYKYIHQRENSRKNKYQSVRYIDVHPLSKVFKENYDSSCVIINNMDNSNDSSSSDEELNNWVCHKDDSEDEGFV